MYLQDLWDLQPKSTSRRGSGGQQFVIFPDAEEDNKSVDENSNLADVKLTEPETEDDEETSLPSMSNGYDCDVGRRYATYFFSFYCHCSRT